MKILFFAYDLPFPLTSGGKIRAYHFIKNLAKKHEIILFCWYRDEEQKKYLPEVKKYCQSIYLFKRRKPWSCLNILLKLFTFLPFALVTYYSNDLKKKLKELIKQEKFDVVHFESFYPALYFPLVKKMGVKTFMANENIEWQIYDKYAASKGFPLNFLLRLEVRRMRQYEEWLWQQADINIALSGPDQKEIQRVTHRPCPLIPNGVNIDDFKPSQHQQNRNVLIYVGTLKYQQNNEAVFRFLKTTYPLIKARIKGVKLILVSWYKPGWLEKYLIADPSIILKQEKDIPVSEFFKQADVLIAPLRIAGGTNIKILEAMAAGLPVLTTSVGAIGLGSEFKSSLCVADSEREFAQMAVALLFDRKQRQKFGLQGRKMVESMYNWEKISEKLLSVYRKIEDEKAA